MPRPKAFIYRNVKLGTVPFRGISSHKPLSVGTVFYVQETGGFSTTRAVMKPKHINEVTRVRVDSVDNDVLFLSRW